jgi:conjugal transfer ATP-binding protein TraC
MANKGPDPIAQAQMQAIREQMAVQAAFQRGITALRDFIAPASLEFQSSLFKIGTRIARTYYVYGYPRQIYTGWISSMVNLDEVIDLSIFIYPVESQVVLNNLRKKVAQLEAGLQIDAEKGKVRDPGKQASIQDAEELRDKLQVGEERFFRFGFTLPSTDEMKRSSNTYLIKWKACLRNNLSIVNQLVLNKSRA